MFTPPRHHGPLNRRMDEDNSERPRGKSPRSSTRRTADGSGRGKLAALLAKGMEAKKGAKRVGQPTSQIFARDPIAPTMTAS